MLAWSTRAALPRPSRLIGLRSISRHRRYASSSPVSPPSGPSSTSRSASTSASSTFASPRRVKKVPRAVGPAKVAPSSPLPIPTSSDGLVRNRREGDDYAEAVASGSTKRRKPKPGEAFRDPNFPSLARLKSFEARKMSPSVKGKEVASPETVARPITKAQGESKMGSDQDKAGPSRQLRRNPVGVQLLSPSLHSQLFPGTPLAQPPNELVDLSREHLRSHGLDPSKAAVMDEINFDLPPLQGQNIRDHFQIVGKQIAEPYLSMAKEFREAKLPPRPEWFVTDTPGWIRYEPDGNVTPVDDLSGETMVSFDVETLYKLSPYPVMAVAASPKYWYSWLTPTIFEDPPLQPAHPLPKWDKSVRKEHPHDLIPLFQDDRPRIVIGHNVGYDRARVAEEYSMERTSTRWLDTLSLHVASRGITSHQVPTWMKYQSSKRVDQSFYDQMREYAEEMDDQVLLASLPSANDSDGSLKWEDVTAINSLAEVAALHCGYTVDKSPRDRFGDEKVTHASQLRNELQDLLHYNANDVQVTHDVYHHVFELFLKTCPHPASFAGVLPMGNSFLPINEQWQRYLRNAEETYRTMEADVKKGFKVLADNIRKAGPDETDPWLSQLDWTPKPARWAEDEEDGGDRPLAVVPSVPPATPNIPASSTGSASSSDSHTATTVPRWYADISTDPQWYTKASYENRLLPLILRLTYDGHPVVYLSEHMWCFQVPSSQASAYGAVHGEPVKPGTGDESFADVSADVVYFRVGTTSKNRVRKLTSKTLVKQGKIGSEYPEIFERLITGSASKVKAELQKCVEETLSKGKDDPWGRQLDWTETQDSTTTNRGTRAKSLKPVRKDRGTWPKWYWSLTSPKSNTLDLTQKKSAAPLLLRLRWQGYPLFLHPEYRWLFRVPISDLKYAHEKNFGKPVDVYASEKVPGTEFDTMGYNYYRIPHKDGEDKNVGSPFAKGFLNAIESGELSPALDPKDQGNGEMSRIAADAMKLNVLCSYWISSRERIMDQFAVYKSENEGMILPQVINMGTVTRRAVESTWLTAANAKKNRVGSELKAMVRAPPGYAIVGADVDSEELWICSVMGDASFGMHGGTALGWMTLEGTKAAGTDLHSKTASILGTSRDAAKVFNYSRIYGAGQKHAVQLLMQGDPTLTKEAAAVKASDLYNATKGQRARRSSQLAPAAFPSLWHGGSESYQFNLIESIAHAEKPLTPALGCGVTSALRKGYLEAGNSYLPSRTNWVVQSSGVDYLHLLITSMEYLIKKYDIKARYLLSVHDEVRYLSQEDDRYRTALALQVANAWTRALFCYNVGMDDLPQGVTFFSAVDIDHVLRKEVFMTCETPSHKMPIPAGESLDINQLLAITNNGDLGQPRVDDRVETGAEVDTKAEGVPAKNVGVPLPLTADLRSHAHYRFLIAQNDRSGKSARKWLMNQPPLLDKEGNALPLEKNERRLVVRDTLESDPSHFQRQRRETFSREELDSILDNAVANGRK